MLLDSSIGGEVLPYQPNLKLLGAVNRNATTCWMDSLLFAMFGRLDSFEAILYNSFADEKRQRLAASLRLWVNMLRTGQLITVDVVSHTTTNQPTCTRGSASHIRLPMLDHRVDKNRVCVTHESVHGGLSRGIGLRMWTGSSSRQVEICRRKLTTFRPRKYSNVWNNAAGRTHKHSNRTLPRHSHSSRTASTCHCSP